MDDLGPIVLLVLVYRDGEPEYLTVPVLEALALMQAEADCGNIVRSKIYPFGVDMRFWGG